MKQNTRKFILLISALFLFSFIVGCNNAKVSFDDTMSFADEVQLGTGENKFTLIVTDNNDNSTKFDISTDKLTVGDALMELGMIDGEEGPYGLYIKSVNGIVVDYNDGGKYWAFFIDGKYATRGVDSTEIETDKTYSLKVCS